MYLWGESVGRVINELFNVLPYIIAAICALSFVMFTYVDNNAKDLTDLRNEVDRQKYILVHARLSDLKREVLANVGAILLFFILERIVKAALDYIVSEQIVSNLWLASVVGTSMRFSCFAVIIVASGCQLLGFIIAVEFRELIASNRK